MREYRHLRPYLVYYLNEDFTFLLDEEKTGKTWRIISLRQCSLLQKQFCTASHLPSPLVEIDIHLDLFEPRPCLGDQFGVPAGLL